MAIGIRGTTPAVASGTGVVSVTLTGTRQPQTDDVLYIIHGNDYYQFSNMSTPTVDGSTSGVAAASGASADGGNLFAHVKTYTWVATSSGDRTVAAVETGAADEEKVLVVYVLTGVDTSGPLDAPGAGNFDSVGSTNHVAPSVLAATAGFLICHSNDGNGSNGNPFTTPGSMTEQYDGNVGGFMGYVGATEQLASSGATGTRTFTGGNSSYAAVSAVFREASATGASPNPGPLVAPPPAVTRASTW